MELEASGDSPVQRQKRPQGPRLYHKKSRTGCLRCKSRRVKCDEKRPSCTGCSRHLVDCVYPYPDASDTHVLKSPGLPAEKKKRGPSPTSGQSTTTSTYAASTPEDVVHAPPSKFNPSEPYPRPIAVSNMASTAAPSTGFLSVHDSSRYSIPLELSGTVPCPPDMESTDPDPNPVLELPESRERRLWELRLLHNYMQMISRARSSYTGSNPPITFQWPDEVPAMGFEHDSVLYAIMAHSALNLWSQETDPARRDHLRLHQRTYLALSLREQQRAVSSLDASTADLVSMASLLIVAHVFALVQTVPTSPWEPPLEWLRVGRGTGTVFTVARAYLTDPSTDRITRYLASPPHFDPDEIFADENRAGLDWLLERDDDPTDHEIVNHKVTRRIYENALCYTGWVRRAIDAGEAEFAVHRRLGAFAVWMPEVFHDFCAQRRPRALVCLAWFFALWIPFDGTWVIGGAGKRQVRGIYEELPAGWRHKVDPLMDEYGLREEGEALEGSAMED